MGNPLVELHHQGRSVLSRRGKVKQEDVRSGRSLLQDVAGTAKHPHHTDARLTREEVSGFLSEEPTRMHNANGRGFGQGVRSNSKPSPKRTKTLAVQIPRAGGFIWSARRSVR